MRRPPVVASLAAGVPNQPRLESEMNKTEGKIEAVLEHEIGPDAAERLAAAFELILTPPEQRKRSREATVRPVDNPI